MKKRSIFISALIVGLILLGASAVSATTVVPVWGTAVTGDDLNSSRSSAADGGVSATGKWADGGFKIEWDIEQLNGDYSYTYTLSAKNEGISDFILETTKGDFGFNIIEGPSPVEGSAKIWDTSAGISLNGLYGIMFDLNDKKSVTITLVTDSAPVWGVFFAANEDKGTYAGAMALSDLDYQANESVRNFIALPGGGSPLAGLTTVPEMPEPPTMLLVGVGLIGLAGLGRNNIFKRKKR